MKLKEHCQCRNDAPDWFVSFMKKFKKDLMKELHLAIHEAVHNEFEKREKHKKNNSDIQTIQTDDEKCILNSPINKHKKKELDKDFGHNFLGEREIKLLKKLEILHPSKFEKLESRLKKLDSKTKLLLEEKKKLLEKKHNRKLKLDKKYSVSVDDIGLKPGKSAFLLEKERKIKHWPEMKFFVNLCIINDGSVPWVDPMLLCLCQFDLKISKPYRPLPRLKPGEMVSFILEGSITKTCGTYEFTCRIIDRFECFASKKICWEEASFKGIQHNSLPKTTNINFSDLAGQSELKNDFYYNQESSLANENFVLQESCASCKPDISMSKKKKVNFNEVDERLCDIDPHELPPVRNSDIEKKYPEFYETDVDKNQHISDINSPMIGCSTYKNVGTDKEKFKKIKELQGKKSFINSLTEATVTNKENEEKDDKTAFYQHYLDNYIIDLLKNSNKDSEEIEKQKKEHDSDTDTDSQLSVILISEEEDNFFVVPFPSKSPSPEPELSFGEKMKKDEVINESQNSATAENFVLNSNAKNEFDMPIIKEELFIGVSDKEELLNEPNCAPFVVEDNSISKKGNSSAYQFAMPNLTQPTNNPYQENLKDRFFTKKNSRNKEEPLPKKDIPTTDSCGRPIFAVNSRGCCLPVEILIANERKRNVLNSDYENQNDKKKQNNSEFRRGEKTNQMGFARRHEEFSSELPVNVISVFVNGASHALNTAKSLCTLVAKRKTKIGKTPCEKNTVSTEELLRLFEMGFEDLKLNEKLLATYDNDLSKVVEKLIFLREKNLNEK